MILQKNCKSCSKLFIKTPSCSRKAWAGRDFCSKHCANSRTRLRGAEPVPGISHGLNGYNTHGCRCDICRDAIRIKKQDLRAGIKIPRSEWGFKEEAHPRWKGDDVGYKNMHVWVARHKTKTGICSHCGVDRGTATGRATHWANIDHTYRRNLDDYIELCPSCHKKYDLAHNRGKRVLL
jgi:hypothetical protein